MGIARSTLQLPTLDLASQLEEQLQPFRRVEVIPAHHGTLP